VQVAPKHSQKPKAKTKHTRYRIYAGHPIQPNKNHPNSTNLKQPQSHSARGQTKGKEPDAEGIRGRKTKTEAQNQTASKISLPANTSNQRPLENQPHKGAQKQNQRSSMPQNRNLERTSSTRTRNSRRTALKTEPKSTPDRRISLNKNLFPQKRFGSTDISCPRKPAPAAAKEKPPAIHNCTPALPQNTISQVPRPFKEQTRPHVNPIHRPPPR